MLDKADFLEAALQSEDVDMINTAIARAGQDKALLSLASRAEALVRETPKAHAEAEAPRRSSVAAAWHAARTNVLSVLRAEADRVCSEAGEKGWDNLEKDLVIDQLAALEAAFEGTDLGGLASAIEELASEDLEVPAAVIEEARHALRGIAMQHEELEVAIRVGDIDTIPAAIELASEHFLPEALVCKARAALDMAISLDMAIKSRDPLLLAKTLAQAECDFAQMPSVQCARRIMDATTALEEAARNDDIDAMRAAMESIEEQLLPEALLGKARMAITLETAIKSHDAGLLEGALSRAERECADMTILQRARGILPAGSALQAVVQDGDARQRPRASIASALQAAVQDGDARQRPRPRAEAEGVLADMPLASRASSLIDAAGDDEASIDAAIEAAKAHGVPTALVDNIEEELAERRTNMSAEALQAIVLGDDMDAIEKAILVAEVQGIRGLDKVREEFTKKKMKKSADALQTAMQGDDLETIDQAIRDAEAQGVSGLDEMRQKKAADVLQQAMQGEDPKAMEAAIRFAEGHGVPGEVVDKARQELEDQREELEQRMVQRRKANFLAGLQATLQCDDTCAMRATIAEGEELGFEQEVKLIRRVLEEELACRKTKLSEERAQHEELAAQFKTAKEAQDFGGSVLAAQWRHAVAKVAKLLALAEE